MRLDQFLVALPVSQVQSTITHYTRRAPTVFELTIMRLLSRVQDHHDGDLGEYTLRQIFETYLGVIGGPALISKSAEELRVLGVLESGVRDEALLDLPLRNVQFTEEGGRFLDRRELPAKEQQSSVEHVYLPWAHRVVPSEDIGRLLQDPPDGAVSADFFADVDVTALVREAVTEGSYPWKRPGTTVRSVESVIVDRAWLMRKLDITLTDDLALHVTCGDDAALTDWIQDADRRTTWNVLLRQSLAAGPTGGAWLNAGQVQQATTVRVLTESEIPPLEIPSDVRMTMVLSDQAIEDETDTQVLVLGPRNRKARIGAEEENVLAVVPQGKALPDGFLAMSITNSGQARLTISGLVPATWGDGQQGIPCLLTLDESSSQAAWDDLRAHLDTKLTEAVNPELLAIPVLWGSKTPFEVMETQRGLGPADCVTAWRGLLDRIQTLNAALTPAQVESLQSALTSHIRSLVMNGQRFDPQQTIALLLALAPFPQTLGPHLDQLQRDALSVTSPAATTDDLRGLRRAALPTVVLPKSVFGPEPLATLVAESMAAQPPRSPLDLEPHELTAALTALHDRTADVRRDLGEAQLDAVRVGGRFVPSESMLAAVSAADRWVLAHQRLHDELGVELPLGPCDEFQSDLDAWKSVVEMELAPALPKGQRYVLVDTNVLLDDPSILQHSHVGDTFVICGTVLQELDGLKKSPEKGPAARAANRAIDNAGGTLHRESASPSLLPSDLPADTRDNQILSVAVKLCLSDVLLISNDINFRNKAAQLHRHAMTGSDYLRPPNPAGPGKKGKTR